MIYLSISLIVILCFTVLGLIINYNQSKEVFQNKIELLESIIEELNANFENQNQKIKLSDDLKLKLKQANDTLSKGIMNMNVDLFETLYSKK
jgi:exonuclease VII small subunit